ncbi:MAG: disulfide bond formation protein DsbA [Gammaproteobacteria bacterium]|nr:MAG: disulfide bond formation protein DsbA [Gammaproteobacteria bacterium]
MSAPLVIDYYSDILCVWAWIAQRRIDELNKQLGDKIELKYHYLDVFGDAVNKIPNQWQGRGGYDGFSAHVVESAANYEDAPVNEHIWSKIRPTSSANPHLVLKAIELAYSPQQSIALALKFRHAFFVDARDISNIEILFAIIENAGLDSLLVNKAILNGSAMAELMHNYQQAKTLGLKGSPSYIIDNGRQILYGNVGYRVLLANIEEQLNKPESEASWC